MFSGMFGQAAARAGEDGSKAQHDGVQDSTAPGAGFSLWGVASAVTQSVCARADEIARGVSDTDWASELSSFRQGVSADAHTASASTAKFVEHLPDAVEHLPRQAATMASKFPEQLQEHYQHTDNFFEKTGRMPTHAAGDSLNVGGTLSQFSASLFQGTRDFVEQVRDGLGDELRPGAPGANKSKGAHGSHTSRGSRQTAPAPFAATHAPPVAKYSRMENEVALLQRDSATFLAEPDDAADFDAWRALFNLESVRAEEKRLLKAAPYVFDLYTRIVPAVLSEELFWTRYFYRLAKLQQKEDQRVALARRVQTISAQEEEELGWDDLDPDVEEGITHDVTAVSRQSAAAPKSLASLAMKEQLEEEIEHEDGESQTMISYQCMQQSKQTDAPADAALSQGSTQDLLQHSAKVSSEQEVAGEVSGGGVADKDAIVEAMAPAALQGLSSVDPAINNPDSQELDTIEHRSESSDGRADWSLVAGGSGTGSSGGAGGGASEGGTAGTSAGGNVECDPNQATLSSGKNEPTCRQKDGNAILGAVAMAENIEGSDKEGGRDHVEGVLRSGTRQEEDDDDWGNWD